MDDEKCQFNGCENPPVTNTYFCDTHLALEKQELILECNKRGYDNPEKYSNYDLLVMLNYPIDGKGRARCSNQGCDEVGYQCNERWRCKECSKEVIFCKEFGCNVRMDEGPDYCDEHEASNEVVASKPDDNICLTTGCNEWKCRTSISSYCWKHTFRLTNEIEDMENPAVNHPPHYTTGKIETIDVITDWNLNYCEGNSRYKHKGSPLQDLKKAEWYLKRLIQENEDK